MTSEQVAVSLSSSTLNEVLLSGTVFDGGFNEINKHGYPLYAKITLTGPDGERIFHTDPFTGTYEALVQAGEEYTILVESVLQGYQAATEVFTISTPTILNFDLTIQDSCVAPGYEPDYEYYFHFEDDSQGFTFGGTNSSWEWGKILSGPGAAHSGMRGIATNLAKIPCYAEKRESE